MLHVKNIHRILGSINVLRGVSFSLEPGSITGLIGPSGGGKSTLLKILAEVARCDSGEIDLGSCNKDDIGLMFQEGALFDSLTVFDNVAFPLVNGRVPSNSLEESERVRVEAAVQSILARVGLSRAAYKLPGELSGGMRRRVALARALVSKPKLVLLDDPTAGLDPVASSVIMNLIVEIQQEYKPTMIIASHDLRRLFPAVEKVIALFDGVVCFHGIIASLKDQGSSELTRFVACRYDLDAAPGTENRL